MSFQDKDSYNKLKVKKSASNESIGVRSLFEISQKNSIKISEINESEEDDKFGDNLNSENDDEKKKNKEEDESSDEKSYENYELKIEENSSFEEKKEKKKEKEKEMKEKRRT